MIPINLIYNDTAAIFDTEPYTLAVTTKGINYEKSQEVIAQIASIVDRHHELMIKAENDVQTINQALSASKYDVPSSFFTMAQDTIPYYLLGKNIFGRECNPYKNIWNIRKNSFHQQLVFLQKGIL